jgi:hypothetical protein
MPTFKSFWAVLILGFTCFGQVQHTNLAQVGPKTFATLPTETNGTVIDCSDCQQTNPCAKGGTGAMANGNVRTTPGVGISENIVPVAGTNLVSNIFNRARYPSQYNWIQSPTSPSTISVGSNTVTLAVGVLGVDTSNSAHAYSVYISGTGTPEAVRVTGGTYTAPAGGTIIFTSGNAHSAGYRIQSATGGLAEASIDAGFNNQHLILDPRANSSGGSVLANAYYFYAPWYPKYSDIIVDCGSAILVNDNPVGIVFNIGQVQSVFRDCRIGAGQSYAAAAITNTACANNVSTITTTLKAPVGSWVDIQNSFNKHYWGIHQVLSSSSTQWTYTDNQCRGAVRAGSGSIAPQADRGGNAPTAAFLIDDGQQTTIENPNFNQPGSLGSNKLNNGMIVLNNQSFVLSAGGLNTGFQCNAFYCGDAVYAPGPFSNYAALISIKDFSASLNCSGNGVKDLAGNTLTIEGNSVIQGYNQFAVMAGTLRGGYGSTHIKGLYSEIGSCGNPMWTVGSTGGIAGVVNIGSPVVWEAGEGPQASIPVFATGGSTTYYYWLVVVDSVDGPSQPLLMGTAAPTGSAVTAYWWRVPDLNTTTYNIIRTTDADHRPYTALCTGGSTSACGSVAKGLTQCSANLCSYTDSVARNTASYTVQDSPAYMPSLYFWPATFVLSAGTPGAYGNGTVDALTISGANATNGQHIVSVTGILNPSVFSLDRSVEPSGALGTWITSPIRTSVGISGSDIMSAQLIQAGQQIGGMNSGYQGVLNLQHLGGGFAGLTDEITLGDAGEPSARSVSSNRPPMNANDTGIGWDNPFAFSAAKAQLAFHAPVSISNYIGVKPDNRSWLTRLTSSGFALATHLNQSTAGKFAGTCTMSSATSCTITLSSPYTSTPGCVVTVQGATAIAGACSVSGTTVTITAASSNSATWAAMLFGNPN